METFDSQGKIPPVIAVDQGLVSKKVVDKEGPGQRSLPPRRLKTANAQKANALEDNQEEPHHIDIRV